jgi:rSAM/selenodomain-associated transferase 2
MALVIIAKNKIPDFFKKSGILVYDILNKSTRFNKWQNMRSPNSNTSKISIIIPVLNEEKNILATIITSQKSINTEVIVVDGGSQDNTYEIAISTGVKVIVSQPGRAIQMNAGAAVASGDILLFLHADTQLPPGFDDMVRKTLNKSNIVAGAFALKINGQAWGLRLIEWGVNIRSKYLQLPYGDQAIFFQSKIFHQIGGFPELPIMEDFELVQCLKSIGRIIIIPTPVLTSGRRWLKYGIIKTTFINQIIITGYFMGVSPQRLANWYRRGIQITRNSDSRLLEEVGNLNFSSKKQFGFILKFILLCIFVTIAIIAFKVLDIQILLQKSLIWVQSLGAFGPLAFIIIYNLATVLFIPGSVLTLGGGVLFGVFWGSIYVFIAATIGATIAFLIGRYVSRDWVSRQLEKYPKFKAIDASVAREGLKIVFLTRLSPLFPFNLLNYAFGITQVSLKDYILGSFGMIPGTIMYVYIGSLAGDIAMIGMKTQTANPTLQWTIRIIGFIATVTVTIYVTRIARKALDDTTMQ